MNPSIHVLQLACLSDASPARLRSLLHSCRTLLAQEAEDLQLSVAVIRSRRHAGDDLAAQAAAKGIRYHEIVRRAPLDATVWWRLGRLIRRLGVDIVHAHDARTHLLALLVQPWFGFRLVATAEEVDARDWLNRFSREVDRKLLPGFDRVIAANNQLARQLCQLGCRRSTVDVIQAGVDTEVFSRDAVGHDVRGELRIAAEAPVVGVLADRLDAADAEILAEARRRAEEAIGPVHLVLIGDALGMAPDVQCGANLAGDRIHWLVGREDLPDVYAALDVFAVLGNQEASSGRVLEAQSMEVPVVCERLATLRDSIDDGTTGLLIEPRDPEALAVALVRLLADRREARSLAAAGRLRICQRHRATDCLRQIATTYRRVMSQA